VMNDNVRHPGVRREETQNGAIRIKAA
jgi:hypothetical protein